MLFDKSKLSEMLDMQRINRVVLSVEGEQLVKDALEKIGFAGILSVLAGLWEEKCTKEGEQTLNYLAIRLRIFAHEVRMFQDDLQVVYRKKPEEKVKNDS